MRFILFIALCLLIGCRSGVEKTLIFAVGDGPYSEQNLESFQRLVAQANQVKPDLSFHAGDITAGYVNCTESWFQKVRALFMTFDSPLLLTPGDNDWIDCEKPAESLSLLRELFFAGQNTLGKSAQPLTRMSQVFPEKGLRENVYFSFRQISFATYHVGTLDDIKEQNRDLVQQELDTIDQQNAIWLRHVFQRAVRDKSQAVVLLHHGEMRFSQVNQNATHFFQTRKAIEREVAAWEKPVLNIHGDFHKFKIDRPLKTHPNGDVLKNFYRLQVFGDPDYQAVLIEVDPSRPQPFSFRPLSAR